MSYKIIYVCYDPMDMRNTMDFGMLEPAFNSEEEAHEYIINSEFPRIKEDLIGDDYEDEYDFEETSNGITASHFGDEFWTIKYSIEKL